MLSRRLETISSSDDLMFITAIYSQYDQMTIYSLPQQRKTSDTTVRSILEL